ncbi:hypothetical protein IscW_ISCW020551 [Ixodes scapularis]|uniref:Uncharacterized protein n=1 Tax=Ixodes scapularis TaxID=6945 RepID=B7PXG3_IXOSC|nr:hypothetical protein IscW_ISCW020551 [Ixodes scapularis]|eukprot:XP_002400596.1 hypothetical protein IscW_ISCW020551 [Ixodes scapularis]
MLSQCHFCALARRLLPSQNRFAFICNTDFTLQCKKFMVVPVLDNKKGLLLFDILPNQRTPYSSLELRIGGWMALGRAPTRTRGKPLEVHACSESLVSAGLCSVLS